MNIFHKHDLGDRAETGVRQFKGLSSRLKPLVLAWAVVYASNLILPLQLGWMLTHHAGRLGMLLAVLLLLALGCRVSIVSPKAGIALVAGGSVVAVSQLFPPLYIIAGAIGMAAAQGLGQAAKHGPGILVESESGGFVATILTGGILMMVAMSIGLPIQWIGARARRRSAARWKPGKGEV